MGCYKCKTTNHNAETCPVLRVCTVCKKRGHIEADCEVKRRQEHLCLECGKRGHFEEECYILKERMKLKCERCRQKGHSKEECTVEYCDVCLTVGHKRWCATLW